MSLSETSELNVAYSMVKIRMILSDFEWQQNFQRHGASRGLSACPWNLRSRFLKMALFDRSYTALY